MSWSLITNQRQDLSRSLSCVLLNMVIKMENKPPMHATGTFNSLVFQNDLSVLVTYLNDKITTADSKDHEGDRFREHSPSLVCLACVPLPHNRPWFKSKLSPGSEEDSCLKHDCFESFPFLFFHFLRRPAACSFRPVAVGVRAYCTVVSLCQLLWRTLISSAQPPPPPPPGCVPAS